jgi:hypothetical protein
MATTASNSRPCVTSRLVKSFSSIMERISPTSPRSFSTRRMEKVARSEVVEVEVEGVVAVVDEAGGEVLSVSAQKQRRLLSRRSMNQMMNQWSRT